MGACVCHYRVFLMRVFSWEVYHMICGRSNRLDVVYWTLNPIRPRSRDKTSSSPPLKPLTTTPSNESSCRRVPSKLKFSPSSGQLFCFASMGSVLAPDGRTTGHEPISANPPSPNATSRGKGGTTSKREGCQSLCVLEEVNRPLKHKKELKVALLGQRSHAPKVWCIPPGLRCSSPIRSSICKVFFWLQSLAKKKELLFFLS